MRLPLRRILTLAALLGTAACSASAGAGTSGTSQPRSRPDLLTREQIEASKYTNVFEVVQALRSNWMNKRGNDTLMGRPSEVLVYMDDSKVGGVQQMKAINASQVMYIRYYDGVSASQRWGLDHGAGVIYVSTRELR